MTTVNSERDFSTSAVIVYPAYYPVNYVEGYGAAEPADLHSTVLWLGEDVDEQGYNADDILFVMTHYYQPSFLEATVTGTVMFGPEKNVPVLTIHHDSLRPDYDRLTAALAGIGVVSASEFGYAPHVTVPLDVWRTPPRTVFLSPMQLWWKDEKFSNLWSA